MKTRFLGVGWKEAFVSPRFAFFFLVGVAWALVMVGRRGGSVSGG